jgi:hypothetical protein
MIVVVTHWNFSKRMAKDYCIPKKIKEFIVLFNQLFKIVLTEEQFVFLDNKINDYGVPDPEEME